MKPKMHRECDVWVCSDAEGNEGSGMTARQAYSDYLTGKIEDTRRVFYEMNSPKLPFWVAVLPKAWHVLQLALTNKKAN
jgi:hypothetical protein